MAKGQLKDGIAKEQRADEQRTDSKRIAGWTNIFVRKAYSIYLFVAAAQSSSNNLLDNEKFIFYSLYSFLFLVTEQQMIQNDRSSHLSFCYPFAICFLVPLLSDCSPSAILLQPNLLQSVPNFHLSQDAVQVYTSMHTQQPSCGFFSIILAIQKYRKIGQFLKNTLYKHLFYKSRPNLSL